MKYTREAFREWLESLPDEPFCRVSCPIGEFMDGMNANEAIGLDYELADRIDDLAMCYPLMLPSDVLKIISELE